MSDSDEEGAAPAAPRQRRNRHKFQTFAERVNEVIRESVLACKGAAPPPPPPPPAAAAAAASAAAAPRADVSRQVSVDPLPRRLRQRVCKPGAAHRGALRGRLGGEVGQQRGAAGVVGGEGAFNIQEGPPCGGVVLGGAGLGIRGMRSGAPGQPGFCFPERICR